MKQENMYAQIDNIDNLRKLEIKNINNPSILRDMPFEKIYESARKEASRKKPVFFIHKYFARRITCNFRLILLGLLLPYEEDIWDYYYKSLDVKDDITLLDPFMGGGTTVFESLRLGLNTIGNDLQPLSKFVTEALVAEIPEARVKKAVKILEKSVGEKIKEYYKTRCPECGKDADVMYNFHVKTVSSNEKCKEHELFSGFVLSLKKDTFTLVCPKCKDVFKTKFDNGEADCPKCGFKINNPKAGFVKSGVFECDECGEHKSLLNFTQEEGYPLNTKIIAQEYYCPNCKSHDYKGVNQEDIDLFSKAKNDYEKLKDKLPIPQQVIPKGYNTNQILNHGYRYFKDLFNERQLLCLGLLLDEIDKWDDDNVKFWLLLAFSGALEMNNMFCRYQHNASKISNIFFNHAYVPIAMPVENNIWGAKLGTGNFTKTIEKILRGKKFNKEIYDIQAVPSNSPSKFDSLKVMSDDKVITNPVNSFEQLGRDKPLITFGDSRNLEHIPDGTVELVVTDPPYGGNIMYSELIDFFHVWNHTSEYGKCIGFSSPLTMKEEEIIVNTTRKLTHDNYQEGLQSVFKEVNRVLKKDGFLVFSFHDKDLESWYSVINSLINSRYQLKAAYPLHAETRTGAHTSNKNSIAFDIILISQKCDIKNEVYDSLDCIIKQAIEKTEGYVIRLNSVNAEVTIPDIENIFLSQFFINIMKSNFKDKINDDDTKERLKESLKSIEDIFSKYQVTETRSGWWSELFKSKWKLK